MLLQNTAISKPVNRKAIAIMNAELKLYPVFANDLNNLKCTEEENSTWFLELLFVTAF